MMRLVALSRAVPFALRVWVFLCMVINCYFKMSFCSNMLLIYRLLTSASMQNVLSFTYDKNQNIARRIVDVQSLL